MPIHPTAIVDKTAEIDPSVEVGAYAVIEPHTRIDAGTRIYPHAYVSEWTTLGPGCQIHPFAMVGHLPQDISFTGAPSYTRIGAETIVREHASVHRGADPDSTTVVGKNCFIMSTAHVGHNCIVGDNVALANGALLAGHVQVGDRAFVSGNAVVHQFTRIGELVMAQGGVRMVTDVPPFMMASDAGVVGVNVIGLRRAGFSSDERMEIRRAYKLLYRSPLLFRAAIDEVERMVQTAPGRRLVEFLRAPSKRGFTGFKKTRRSHAEQAIE